MIRSTRPRRRSGARLDHVRGGYDAESWVSPLPSFFKDVNLRAKLYNPKCGSVRTAGKFFQDKCKLLKHFCREAILKLCPMNKFLPKLTIIEGQS